MFKSLLSPFRFALIGCLILAAETPVFGQTDSVSASSQASAGQKAIGAAGQLSTTFTSNFHIVAGDLSFKNHLITVSGCTVTIDGPHRFAGLIVTGNGSVTHSTGMVGGLDLDIRGDVRIDPGSAITASGRGFGAESGPGAGVYVGSSGRSSGGGYGGLGGRSALNQCYGSVTHPLDLGSGGGSTNGARGGGIVHLYVSGVMTVNGQVRSGGNHASGAAGGGSGGSILLEVGELAGGSSGFIYADGGYNGSSYNGSGGGGRVAIHYNQNSYVGTFRARTSQRDGNTHLGGAGTVYLKDRGLPLGELTLDNWSYNGATTFLPGDTNLAMNVTIRRYAKLSTEWEDSGSGYQVGALLELTIQGNLTIEPLGFVTVSGYGAPAEQGPGAGVYEGTSGRATGGGYGGRGGRSSANQCYGSITQPISNGSGGGSTSGTRGGGAMHLTVQGVMTVDGYVSSGGKHASGAAGGGSGGSIYLEVGELAGSSSGYIYADGGYNGSSYNGSGGGGRIAIYYDQNSFSGTYRARTSLRDGNTHLGGAGTVYLKDRGLVLGELTLDNAGYNGTSSYIPDVTNLAMNVTVRNYAKLSTQWVDSGNGYQVGAPLELTVQGDLSIDSLGFMTVDGYGEPAESGSGAGTFSGTSGRASGGGYGGLGGRSGGNQYYGSITSPMDLGSGGGSTNGARGGGAMHVTVLGTMTVDGYVSSGGSHASGAAGGGSGGSVLLEVGELAGSSSGYVYADGGFNGSSYNGTGGGGRVAVYYDANNFAGTFRARTSQRDGNSHLGGAGTVYLKDKAQSLGDVTIDNQGYTGTATELPGSTTLAANMTIVGPSWLSAGYNAMNPAASSLLLNLEGDLLVTSGAYISMSGKGYPLGNGPGAGSSAAGTGSGGGYGGMGGGSGQGAAGGNTYGSLLEPVDIGSGGGYPAGGYGGGSMQLFVAGTFTLEGTLYANGTGASSNGGGGSGGSIHIETDQLAGFGWMYANGGSRSGTGGGGGGGRISILTDSCVAYEIAHLEASGAQNGADGSVHLGTQIPLTGDVMISSNDPAWTMAVPSPYLTNQLIDINNGPPFPGMGTWLPLTWRHNDLHAERDFRSEPNGIIDLTGSLIEVVAPSTVAAGLYENSAEVRIFAEKSGWTLTQNVEVDFTTPGTYSEVSALTGGTIPTGTEVNSHLLHFDTINMAEIIAQGSMTFDSDILGVIATSANLDLSDAELQAAGCTYPAGLADRGMEIDLTDDYLVLDADQRTLHYHGRVRDWLDQVRVITRVPDPQTEAYVSTYDFTDGIDEVTHDNVSSAWYRYTFDLPVGFSNAELIGRALLDDQGVVFLNGHQISGDMTISGYDPDPSLGPNDPPYAMNDTGKDLTDLFGRRILTAPSPDPFCNFVSGFFVEGPNELIFGVCADASYWYPTGLEFEAVVNFTAP